MQTKHKEWEPLPKSALKERVLAATRQWFSPIREIVSSTQVEDIVYLGGFYDKDPPQHVRVHSCS